MGGTTNPFLHKNLKNILTLQQAKYILKLLIYLIKTNFKGPFFSNTNGVNCGKFNSAMPYIFGVKHYISSDKKNI